LQYAFEDFGIRQVAQLLGKADDEEKYANRSLVSRLLHCKHPTES
jgi:putative alpha-1,2-mannosidase